MAPFDDFLREIETGVVKIAQMKAISFPQQVESDGQTFFHTLTADLQIRLKQLANYELSLSDFEFVVRRKKDLPEVKALTQAGIAAVKIGQIRLAMVDLVISAAGKLF